jgi:hypothetical protein
LDSIAKAKALDSIVKAKALESIAMGTDSCQTKVWIPARLKFGRIIEYFTRRNNVDLLGGGIEIGAILHECYYDCFWE